MKRLFFLFCLAVCFSFAPTNAQAENTDSLHTIAVEGTSSLTTAPDLASLSIGVTTYKTKAIDAQQENAATTAAVIARLKSLGIDPSDIQTSNYHFTPVYSNDPRHTNEIEGYTTDNVIHVTVNDIQLLGTVIDTALHSGANKIDSIDFTISNPQEVQQRALETAVANARAKADILAAAAGKQVINVLRISENRTYIQNRNVAMLSLAKETAGTTPIEAGDINVQASVQIEFVMD